MIFSAPVIFSLVVGCEKIKEEITKMKKNERNILDFIISSDNK
jgi:hypothetical protein